MQEWNAVYESRPVLQRKPQKSRQLDEQQFQ